MNKKLKISNIINKSKNKTYQTPFKLEFSRGHNIKANGLKDKS